MEDSRPSELSSPIDENRVLLDEELIKLPGSSSQSKSALKPDAMSKSGSGRVMGGEERAAVVLEGSARLMEILGGDKPWDKLQLLLSMGEVWVLLIGGDADKHKLLVKACSLPVRVLSEDRSERSLLWHLLILGTGIFLSFDCTVSSSELKPTGTLLKG